MARQWTEKQWTELHDCFKLQRRICLLSQDLVAALVVVSRHFSLHQAVRGAADACIDVGHDMELASYFTALDKVHEKTANGVVESLKLLEEDNNELEDK